MENICSCCGKKLPFLDVGFDLIEIEGEDYYVCSVCNVNFSAYKSGNLPFKELVNDSTKPNAGDLRFIKNLIIFGLVCGVLLGIISIFGIL